MLKSAKMADKGTIKIAYMQEFRQKTIPVIQHYNELGLLIRVNGDQPRNAVFNEIVEKLYQKAVSAES